MIHIFQRHFYLQADFQLRRLGSVLQMLVLTGGERRPHGNCSHDMHGYMTWCPTLVFIAVVTLQLAPYLCSLSSVSGSKEDQPLPQMLLRLQVKWLHWRQTFLSLSLCELLLWHVHHHVCVPPKWWPLCWSNTFRVFIYDVISFYTISNSYHNFQTTGL